jgi:hypothetical protein
MNHLKNLLEGAKQVLVLNTGATYVRPSRKDFAKDVANLRNDSEKVTSALNRNTRYCVK